MTLTPFMSNAKLTPAQVERPTSLLPHGTVVWERIMALAALAQALDPSLPPAIRCVKRAPVEPQERLATPFRIVFTRNEKDGDANDLLNDPTQQEFWSTLARVLPPEFVAAERALVDNSPSKRFPTAQDAAIYQAFSDARVRILNRPTQDPDHLVVATGASRPLLYPLFNTPELGRALWLPESAPVDSLPSQQKGYLGRVRQKVRMVRAALSEPMENMSRVRRDEVFNTIRELDEQVRPRLDNGERERRGPNEYLPRFESEQEHGWIAFALSRGRSDWVGGLLAAGASPHTTYGGVCPMAWAIAQDNLPAVKQLLDADVSPNTQLRGWPKVYDDRHQQHFADMEERFIPLLSFAAVIGASRTAHALIEAGADVNGYTDQLRFPLMLAAMNGDEGMARMLVSKGANTGQEDQYGRIPAEALSADPAYDGLYHLLNVTGPRATAETQTDLDAAFNLALEETATPPATSLGSRLVQRRKAVTAQVTTPRPRTPKM